MPAPTRGIPRRQGMVLSQGSSRYLTELALEACVLSREEFVSRHAPLLEYRLPLPGELTPASVAFFLRPRDAQGELVHLGRDKQNDVVARAPSVSRFHATISFEMPCARIRDEGSSCGTFVDGVRLLPGRWCDLAPVAEVRLGMVALNYHTAASLYDSLRTAA